MDGERRDHPLDPRHQRVSAAEVVEDDDTAARTADAAHLARDRHRIRYDADHVRRVHDIEGIVAEFEVGGVHLQQTYVPDAFARDALACLFEHRAREVDARDRAIAWIERGVDARTDADFEDAVAGPDPHPLDRVHPPRMEHRAEREVVDGGELFVNFCYKIV